MAIPAFLSGQNRLMELDSYFIVKIPRNRDNSFFLWSLSSPPPSIFTSAGQRLLSFRPPISTFQPPFFPFHSNSRDSKIPV
jgi:hypothetical protein